MGGFERKAVDNDGNDCQNEKLVHVAGNTIKLYYINKRYLV